MFKRINIWAAIFDLAATGAAAIYAADCIRVLFSGAKFCELDAILGVIIITCSSLVWLPYRVMPRMMALANRRVRETMAVTLLSEWEYLWPQIRWRLLRAALPWLCGAAPIIIALLIYDHTFDVENVNFWCNCALVFTAAVLTMLGFMAANFNRVCRMKSIHETDSAVIFYIIPLVAAVICIGVPVGVYWTILQINQATHITDFNTWVNLVYFWAGLAWALYNIRKILADYYQFE